jgi:DNA-binding SARP family transcriptional activator
MALAKRALSEGRGDDALRWFVAHQRRSSSSLHIEALWGEAEALELLGRYADAERALERLIRRDPSSSYAAAARRRLGR